MRLARLEWITSYRVGPKSISLHREGANPILELSQSLATPSDIPRTYFTTSHLWEDSSKNQSMSSCVKQLDTLMVEGITYMITFHDMTYNVVTMLSLSISFNTGVGSTSLFC